MCRGLRIPGLLRVQSGRFWCRLENTFEPAGYHVVNLRAAMAPAVLRGRRNCVSSARASSAASSNADNDMVYFAYRNLPRLISPRSESWLRHLFRRPIFDEVVQDKCVNGYFPGADRVRGGGIDCSPQRPEDGSPASLSKVVGGGAPIPRPSPIRHEPRDTSNASPALSIGPLSTPYPLDLDCSTALLV